MEDLRHEVAELRKDYYELQRQCDALGIQVKHIDECTDEAKVDIKTLSGRLFGQPSGPGELFKMKATIRNYVMFLAGAGAVIQFLFGTGLFSLNTLIKR